MFITTTPAQFDAIMAATPPIGMIFVNETVITTNVANVIANYGGHSLSYLFPLGSIAETAFLAKYPSAVKVNAFTGL